MFTFLQVHLPGVEVFPYEHSPLQPSPPPQVPLPWSQPAFGCGNRGGEGWGKVREQWEGRQWQQLLGESLRHDQLCFSHCVLDDVTSWLLGSSSAVCEVQILYFFANADVQLGFEMWLWSLHMHAVYFFFQFIFEFFFTQAVINIRHIYNVC